MLHITLDTTNHEDRHYLAWLDSDPATTMRLAHLPETDHEQGVAEQALETLSKASSVAVVERTDSG